MSKKHLKKIIKEEYQKVIKEIGKTRFTNPIHVIVSPSWKDKFMRYDLLKKRCRELLDEAGIVGGLMIYHPLTHLLQVNG